MFTNSPVEAFHTCKMFAWFMVATISSVGLIKVKYLIFDPYTFNICCFFCVSRNRVPCRIKNKCLLLTYPILFKCVCYFLKILCNGVFYLVRPSINVIFYSCHTLQYVIKDYCPYFCKNALGVLETL